MFNLSPFTLVALTMIALFIYGPDKLPKAVGEGARSLRRLRALLRGATEDVRKELGPEYQNLQLADLNPRSFIRKHLLEDEKEWQRPEPPWAPGPKPEGWPVNVPYPSAAEMGLKEGEDSFTAPIPRTETPPTPPPRNAPQPLAEQAPPPADTEGKVSLEKSGEPYATARSQA